MAPPLLRRARRRLSTHVLLILMVIGVLFATTSTASAAIVLERDEDQRCVNWGGGQPDKQGVVRYVCNSTVMRIDRNGSVIRMALVLPPGGANVVDSAPSPDGTTLYLTYYDDVTYQGRNVRKPIVGRFTYDGTAWRHDANWSLDHYPYGGRTWLPVTYHFTADWDGNLYISTGLHQFPLDLPNSIVKYDKDGNYITRFGELAPGRNTDLSSWEEGKFFYSQTGVGVTTDGRSVFTGEYGNGRVQRFDRQADGSYRYVAKWGNTPQTSNANRDGRCVARDARGLTLGENVGNEAGVVNRGLFAVIYDVVVDPANRVHVLNTTCSQVSTFTTGGAHIRTVQSGVRLEDVPHAMVLTGNYGILIPKGGDDNGSSPYLTHLRDTAPPAWPDGGDDGNDDDDDDNGTQINRAPRITSIAGPARTRFRAVKLRIGATDDGTITHMRLVDAGSTAQMREINAGSWRAYSSTAAVTLRPQLGRHVVLVQVRDSRGAVSRVKARVVNLVRDTKAPVIRSLRITDQGGRKVNVVTRVTDDVSGVSHMRFALDPVTLRTARWYPYRTPQGVNFPSSGSFTMYVQVRDRSGRTSVVARRAVVVS